MKCSTSKAALVADWSFSSSDTSPRQKSDDRTSVGRKCRAAKVDLPEPDTPTSATRESSGILMVVIGEHRHLGRLAKLVVLGADRRQRHLCSHAPGHCAGPVGELGSGPLEAVVPVAERTRRQVLEPDVVLDVGCGHDTCAGRAWANTARSKLTQARRVEVLDHLHHSRGVETDQPPVPVSERALDKSIRLRWRGAIVSRCKSRAADLQRRGTRRRRRRPCSTSVSFNSGRPASRSRSRGRARVGRRWHDGSRRPPPMRCSFRLMGLLDGLFLGVVDSLGLVGVWLGSSSISRARPRG